VRVTVHVPGTTVFLRFVIDVEDSRGLLATNHTGSFPLTRGGIARKISRRFPQQRELESTARQAGRALGRRILIIPTTSEDDFETAVTSVANQGEAGLVIPDRPLFVSRHNQLATLVARRSIPAIFPPADLAASGGLMSYGASTFEMFRRAGVFVGKILQGAKPAEMPVEQPTRITLKINLKAAKLLGLTIPPALLVRADEVIE
jgi:putative tryptophan/tyrosine transport system substrate-binding protein